MHVRFRVTYKCLCIYSTYVHTYIIYVRIYVYTYIVLYIPCSNPQLKDLPLQLGFLKNCWELNLNGLNLTKIPPHLRPGEHKWCGCVYILCAPTPCSGYIQAYVFYLLVVQSTGLCSVV